MKRSWTKTKLPQGAVLYVNRRYPALQARLAEHFDEFLQRHTTDIQLRNRTQLRRLEHIGSEGPSSALVKHYRTTTFRLGHCDWLRGHQAVREFKQDCGVYARANPYMWRHQQALIPRIQKRLNNGQGQPVFVQHAPPS